MRRAKRSGPRCARGGWSLVELMVALVIVAILLRLAMPAYQQYLQRGHRADAVRELLRVAACQERVRAATGYYDTTRCIGAIPGGRYRFAFEPTGATATLIYVARAEPLRPDRADRCGTLGIDQSGSRMISGASNRLADCWGGR